MIDLATTTAAISAFTSAVGLFDKIADQIERFITKSEAPKVPNEFRMTIVEEDGAIVSREYGKLAQRITSTDLEQLPESQLKHVLVLEKSMRNHYSIWKKVYPELALLEHIQKAKVEIQLEEIIRDMKGDLEGILSFLKSCGLSLDDHYMHIRDLVKDL